MTTSHLPSLNALRAFEAAGRHLSLTAAAGELHVTPSAISHQIRQLELDLNVGLLERSPGRVRLTEAGQNLLTGLSEGFGRIIESVSTLRRQGAGHVLTVSMLSTFAMRWLIPRLGTFQAAYPGIDIRIATSMALADFARDGIDCAIRFGTGNWPGVTVDRLFTEHLTPVCSPRLTAGTQPLARPEDLRHHRLLHARMRPDDWSVWLKAAGVDEVDARQGPQFETRNFAIHAAVQGMGVAIIDPALVASELASGQLACPFPQALPLDGAYFLVHPETAKVKPAFGIFRAWLLAEARSTGSGVPGSSESLPRTKV